MLREPAVTHARRISISGVVQGVGFRPYVYRLARECGLHGWVLNAERGVEIHVEGSEDRLERFARRLRAHPPPAARIAVVETADAAVQHFGDFEIRISQKHTIPTVRVSPDLPMCGDCLRELFDPADRRHLYPYINCTNCGPRYSIVRSLPYDRARTTMAAWPMCAACLREYEDPLDRRFHAQPVACPACGPQYALEIDGETLRATAAIERAAQLLCDGAILAVKGIGGYHLACDARNAVAVAALRERKYRKERPFAVMARDLAEVRAIAEVDEAARELLESVARPIVLLPARETLDGVAPENDEIGVMLPYAPLHHLLFYFDAPRALVMTSANRSSEPIAYEDDDAQARLRGIADALLVGERPIARRVDDSVMRPAAFGAAVLRHARGCAPQAVAQIESRQTILALGGDLKNAIALAVNGTVFLSQHVGDLEQRSAYDAFRQTASDLCAMYEVSLPGAIVVSDAHPQYRSSALAHELREDAVSVQHHRAHVASVLAERGAWDDRVTGIAFDGTGYGDDGTIWGGEIFDGSLRDGLKRVAHLRPAQLPGGDAAARYPVQCAAGFLAQIDAPPMCEPPFGFPRERYDRSREMLAKNVRVFTTTSVGRLFDAFAAIAGFTREITFEGQAAMWLEHLARSHHGAMAAYAFRFDDGELDFRLALQQAVNDRVNGRDPAEIAYAFHAGLANAIVKACEAIGNERIVASGGVFQNALLLELLFERLGDRLWINRSLPANDGGLALGQIALASVR